MNLSAWMRLIGCLAAETTALLAAAALLQSWLRSPRAARTIWQGALAAVALMWIIQLSGLSSEISRPPNPQFLITARILPTPAPQTKIANRVAEADITPAIQTSDAVKWPGWIWFGGSALLLARFILARVWLAVRRRAAVNVDEESLRLIARWQKPLRLHRVRSQVWLGLRSPVAFGVFTPTIALPRDFSVRFSSAEQEAMLAHEMAHLAAHDPFWLMVSDAALALAWWHPVVWWARCRLQSASESAADEASALVSGGAHALASCLVRLGHELTASGPARSLGVKGNGPRSQLARRVELLLREPRAWRPISVWLRWVPQVSAILVGLASVLLPNQTGLSGSILAVLATTAEPARAESQPVAASSIIASNQTPTNIETSAKFKVVATGNAPFTYQWVFDGNSNSPATILSPPAKLSVVSNTDISLAAVTPTEPSVPKIPSLDRTNSRPEVTLTSKILVVTDHSADDIGLDWIFGKAPADNAVAQVSHDLNALNILKSPPLATANPTNLVIDFFHTDGQSAILTSKQFAALRDRIVDKSGTFLGSPRLTTRSGLEGVVSTCDAGTYVTGVDALNGSATNNALVEYHADNINLGLSIDILPTQEKDGRWRLRVLASETSFIGYDKYGKDFASVSNPGGKPLRYDIPHPHFRAVQADSDDTLALGQTLALRGPLWTEVTKTKGHFLIPGKTETVRKRLYVFVTPTQDH